MEEGRLLHKAVEACVCFFPQSFVIIMEKKNIIYNIGGCGVQEMEQERDLCCDIEIRKNSPCELINGMQI